MPETNYPVGNVAQGSVPDDAAQAQANTEAQIPLQEATNTPAEGESISALLSETPDKKAPPATQTEEAEPGWYKKRFAKDSARIIADINAEWERKLAPLYESMSEREAEALVKSGEIKNMETAREFVRLKNGAPAAKPSAQPDTRDAKGRFTTPPTPEPVPQSTADKVDPAVRARAEILIAQAKKIKNAGGPDVLAAYRSTPEIREKVDSGEFDFHDVAANMTPARTGTSPAPVRSANGPNIALADIAHMSDAQFAKLEEGLKNGKKYDLRK